MHFDILTIFPDFFTGPFDYGILKRARTTGLVSIATHDLRGFTHDRHRTVDDRPFGGGEGMVLKAQPIYDAVQSLKISPKAERQRQKRDCNPAVGARAAVHAVSGSGVCRDRAGGAPLWTV